MNWVKTVFVQKEPKNESVRYSTKKSSFTGISLSQEHVEKHFSHSLQLHHTKYLDMLKSEFQAIYANPPRCKKPSTDFDEVRVLGAGAFGTVYLVRDIFTFTYHAMKVIDKQVVMQKRNIKSIFSEKKIMQSLNFPFVTSLDYTSKDNLYVYFILPFESGGELFSLVRRLGSLSEPLQLFYAAQIVLALEYLHHCGVIHRDVKPENVMISESGYIKLGDFGFSKIIKKRTWTLCGTPEYLAPELIMSQGYTFSVDWWSMGVLIYEMSAGYPPFCASDPMKLYKKILTGHFRTPDCMTYACKSLIKCLLEVDPLKRFGSLKAGVYDIKSHIWFQETDWNLILHRKVIPPYRPVYKNPGDAADFAEVFRALEYPAELAKQEFHRERLVSQRQYLIQFVVEFSGNNSEELSEHLALYERVLEEASDGGLSLDVKGNFPAAEEKWSILQAVFFASTVLTTIGYGNIVPETFWGRLFCIAYALIGIPLTLTVIADLGKAFATVVSVIAKQLPPMPKCCAKVSEANPTGQRSLYALGAVGFLFLYLSAGAGLFKMWEDDWTFYDGFYFCFITMTTIGFGDLVPKKPKYMLICTLYILIGLALTSTIIELVRRQYARSWQQLRALSGPLADTLRRLGDAGLGVDVSSLHSDLRKVLTVVTLSRLSMSGANGLSEKRQMEWEAAMVEAVIRDVTSPAVEKKPPVVQIVIYESSV